LRYFPPALEIAADEGFDSQKDIFHRADFARGLTNLVTESEDPLVILLDAPWGTGKTTFIRMWAGELRKLGFPVIYFDAFENDHVENGFIAIVGEVIRLSEALEQTKTKPYKKFIEKARRLGGILLRTSARIGVKAATLGAIDAADIDALKSVADDVAKATSTKADQYIESLLKLQSQEKESLIALREALAELAATFSVETAEDSVKPIIFIIDELDRCRPNFALEMLERIKHIFSIPNVHFFLAAQSEQLENSVKFNYGNDIDARTYLQKFYNVVVNFPSQGKGRHENPISQYIAFLTRTLSLSKDDMSIIAYFSAARGLSFRTIERVTTSLALARSFVPQNHLWLNAIIAPLCVMKIIEPSLFRRACNQAISLQEIKDFIEFGKSNAADFLLNERWFLGWWRFCLSPTEPSHADADAQPFLNHLFNYSIDRERIVPIMARYLDTFQAPQ
jgi:hypothetical protein